MAEKAATSVQVIEVAPSEILTEGRRVETLLRSPAVEVKRLSIAKGTEIPTHDAPGEITVHCVVGRIAFTAGGATHDIPAGRMIHLPPREPHSLVGLEHSVVLVTKLAAAPVGA